MAIPLLIATAVGGNVRTFDAVTYATFVPTGPAAIRSLFQVGPLIFALDVPSAGVSHVWVSSDFGNTYTQRGGATPANVTGLSFLFITGKGTWLVTGTGQIMRSPDQGTTWATLTGGLPGIGDNFFIRGMAIFGSAIALIADDNTNNAKSGIWTSTDDGQTWTQLFSTANGAASSGQFLRGEGFQVFNAAPWVMNRYTTAGGSNQFNSATNTSGPGVLGDPPVNNGTGLAFARDANGIWRGWDGQANEWHASDANIDVPTLTAGPAAVSNGPSRCVVTVKGSNLFGISNALAHFVKSADNGTTWVDTGLSPNENAILLVLPVDQEGLTLLLGSGLGAGVSGLASGIRFPRIPLLPRP